MKSKSVVSGIFLLWLTLILAMFFIVQKPSALSIASGLFSVLATVLIGLLIAVVGAGLGYFILSFFQLEIESAPRLILSTGVGMGLLGLLGFGLAASGLADGWLLTLLLLGALSGLIWKQYLSQALADLRTLWHELADSASSSSALLIAWLALIELFFTFLLSLAPPVEAFDGLFYHLVVPAMWLRDGGLQLVNMPHYWFPSLMEGMFVWPLSLGLDSTPQFIHLIFGILSVLLVWHWTRSLFNVRAAWWSVAMFLCMPSLPWLASWAYTDLGLIFYSLSALFALLKWKESSNENWLYVSGLMAGFSVGIKYTSFALPLVILLLLFWWTKNKFPTRFVKFGIAGILTGFPWYLRNWIFTGNPFYPFAFGGKNWDAFRSAWYAGAGSGIGWDLPQIFSLPLVTTLGYRDANFFDGRFGPFFLIFFPAVIWVLWSAWKKDTPNKSALAALALVSLSNMIFWTFGVINTSHLMQARLLWPALIPLVPFMSAGILELESLNTPKFKPGFIVSTLIKLVICIFLLDFSLFVIVRNPFMVAMGSESREAYLSRMQPGYAQALTLVNQTPPDAFIYLLNEPRTYGMDRRVQPDAINDNLPHDFYLHSENTELLAAWRAAGYTHVLMAKSVFIQETSHAEIMNDDYFKRLDDLIALLVKVEDAKSEDYLLFEIPPAK